MHLHHVRTLLHSMAMVAAIGCHPWQWRYPLKAESTYWELRYCSPWCKLLVQKQTTLITALIPTCMACGVSVASHKRYSLREARPCILSLFGILWKGGSLVWMPIYKIVPNTDKRLGISFPWHLEHLRNVSEWCHSEPWHAVPHFIFLQMSPHITIFETKTK